MRVDPDHRLVAESLEAERNGKLRTLSEKRQERERQREQDRKVLSDQQRAATLSLAKNLPQLWRDPNTPDRERKRMVRLLLPITLVRGDEITLHIRFKGGGAKTLDAASSAQRVATAGHQSRCGPRDRPASRSTHVSENRRHTERTRHELRREKSVHGSNRRAHSAKLQPHAAL
jgi:hypothetical protein